MTNSTQGPARKYFISAVSAGIMMFGGSLCVAGMSMADTIGNPVPTSNAEAPRFTPIAPAEAPRFTPIAPADLDSAALASRGTKCTTPAAHVTHLMDAPIWPSNIHVSLVIVDGVVDLACSN